MKKHLAIFTKEYITQIFAGKKTIESRFSQKRIPPFGKVNVGDTVFIKLSGSDVKGQFKVKKIIYFENLDDKDWELIKSHYAQYISSGDPQKDQDFFEKRKLAKYATIIWMENIEQFITSPIRISKKDQRGWMVL